jgi:hypothetical protein
VKSATFISMGKLFRKWKSEMNRNYVKKGLVPKYMGKITEAQWKKFAQQKNNPENLATSKEYAEMSKKNIYPHRMGSSGYVGKIPEWKEKIEEVVSAGNPNLVEDINERAVNWLLARLELTQDGKLVHKKKGVAAVQEKAVELTTKQRLGNLSLTGRKTFLVELSAPLNTLDTFMASLLRCRGKFVSQKMSGAIRSGIDTRKTLKMRLKRK